jgi:hypothetical protein
MSITQRSSRRWSSIDLVGLRLEEKNPGRLITQIEGAFKRWGRRSHRVLSRFYGFSNNNFPLSGGCSERMPPYLTQFNALERKKVLMISKCDIPRVLLPTTEPWFTNQKCFRFNLCKRNALMDGYALSVLKNTRSNRSDANRKI